MRHSAPDHLYYAVFMPVVSLDALAGEVDCEIFDIRDDETPSPEDRLAANQTLHILDRFLDSLSTRERVIVEGVHWQGLTQSDVARQLGVSKMAISKTLARIYEGARHLLGKAEYLSFAN